jgi:deazaflavin-dependent oxidoreductase (nitroreductase family)
MAKVYGVIQEPLDRLVYRLTGGTTTASSFLGGVEITMLTTTGARTGRTSALPVLGVPDGDDTILIASNYGRPRNPAWYHNLRANPEAMAEANRKQFRVLAAIATGTERDRLWNQHVAAFPYFGEYPAMTERVIPVISLERID